MRRNDREITDKAIIDRIIDEADICFLGLQDNDEPYVVPMNFGYDGESFYFHSAINGRKVELIKQNRSACISIGIQEKVIKSDIACKWSINYSSVIAWGKPEIIDDAGEKLEALRCLMKHFTNNNLIYESEKIKNTLIFRVKIEKITAKRKS